MKNKQTKNILSIEDKKKQERAKTVVKREIGMQTLKKIIVKSAIRKAISLHPMGDQKERSAQRAA